MSRPTKVFTVADSPAELWLEPQCAEDSYEGRNWCEDNVWDDLCSNCGSPVVRYVRADIADALRAEVERIRALIADDGYAVSFQTMGQYRNALLAALAGQQGERDA